jgi:hypothetical protein
MNYLFGKEIKLTVDGTILRVANIYRAQTGFILSAITKLAYLQGYTVGYSFSRKSWLFE